jgi:squalene synthase HpnC
MDHCGGSTEITDRRPMPAGLPGIGEVDGRRSAENFSVALRLLPARQRGDLVAIYGFARLVDEIGDTYAGDRLAALAWLEHDLEATRSGDAEHPVVRRLASTVQRLDLGLDAFRDLIDANRRDQRQTRYATFEDLLDYCRLSANPVGRLVLAVFAVSDPRAPALSDDVCSALQIIEHLQDVAEDARTGRIYLPADDLARFGCTDADLVGASAGAPLRALIRSESGRAASLLESGSPLLDLLTGHARLAVAGFVAGGWATLDAMEAADFDVLGRRCAPSRLNTARQVGRLLLAGDRRRRASRRRARERR